MVFVDFSLFLLFVSDQRILLENMKAPWTPRTIDPIQRGTRGAVDSDVAEAERR